MDTIIKSCGIAAIALTALLGTSLCSANAQTVRDLTVEQTQVYQSGQVKPSTLTVTTLLDRADATYATGETVRIAVRTNEDAYVTVLNIGASGKVTQLFPNAFQSDNKVKAGEVVEVPAKASGAEIKVTGPVGAELIKVIATSKPMPVVSEAALKPAGVFRSLEGDFTALNRDLTVMAAKPPAETKIAVANQVIKTIASRPAAAPAPSGGGYVVPTPVILPVVPAAQTFPLLLATDKSSYKAGEKVTMAVTPLQACYLSVVDVDSAGRVRVLFPTRALPSNKLAAGQTVMLSGARAPQTLSAGGPGEENVYALCSSEARPVIAKDLKAATDVLADDEKSGLERDLSVVAAKPAATVGLAHLELTITP